MRQRRILVATLLLPLLASLLPVAGVSANRIALATGSCLQTAIDEAPPGAIIALAVGQYAGNFKIEKDLTLVGPEQGIAELIGKNTGTVLTICGEETFVELQHLTISRARGFKGHGVAVDDTATVVMESINLHSNQWHGLWTADRSVVRLRNCILRENGSAGLATEDFAQVHLEHCTIADNVSHGLFLMHLSEVAASRCLLEGNWAGVWAWDAVRLELIDCNLLQNGDYGAIASNAALIVAKGSGIQMNGSHGLLFEESSRGILEDCVVSENGGDGLFAAQDAILQITSCRFKLNTGAGIRMAAAECIGGFDPQVFFAGRVEGVGNCIPGPLEENGNRQVSLCPSEGVMWPIGFRVAE